MAHPSREKYFGYLKEKLGDVHIQVDDGCGLLENCLRSWEWFDKSADYHLVVQDDAIICESFHKRLDNLLNNGIFMYSLYHANRPTFKDEVEIAMAGPGYIIKNSVHSGLAIALPTKLIPGMISHFETLDDPADDVRIGIWAKKIGLKNFIPIPSLVDHRADPSLHGNNPVNKYTKAYKFIDNI